MVATLIAANTVSDVDEFLAHIGVKGMKWGVRKARPMSMHPRGGSIGGGQGLARRAVPAAAPAARGGSTRQQRRIASGQAQINRYGSTKSAVLHLAGRYTAESIVLNAAGMATRAIPNKTVAMGAQAAIGAIGVGVAIRDINAGVKLAQASKANKGSSRGTSK